MSEAGRTAAIFGCSGPVLTDAERQFFREADPFGFILFARNIDNPAQVFALTQELRSTVGRDAPIFVDQEGGRVQRLRAPHWREWLPPLEAVERAGDRAARMLWLRYRLIAEDLRAVGIDGNCAPVADIRTAATHPFLANRCLADEGGARGGACRAAAEAHLAGGVLPVMKHLPGHGRAAADTHHDLPTVTASREELAATDFAAFRALADLPLAMTGHVVFSAYDAQPATLSGPMVGVIRDEIGFSGLPHDGRSVDAGPLGRDRRAGGGGHRGRLRSGAPLQRRTGRDGGRGRRRGRDGARGAGARRSGAGPPQAARAG